MKKFDVEEIKLFITRNYQWGDPSEWTNFHYKELSRYIEQATGDSISDETLKRIFGKRKVKSGSYQPQAYTQLALLKLVETFEEKPNFKKPSATRLWPYLVIVMALVATAVLLIRYYEPTPKGYSFVCDNPVDTAPFTTRFYYNISSLHDSVFASFMPGEETWLPPENSLINYFYKNVGVHTVTFFTRSHVLDTLDIIGQMDKWQAGYFPNNEPEHFKPFINQEFFRQDSVYFASPQQLMDEGVDLKEEYYVAYKYFAPFSLSLDSTVFFARLFNNESTGSYLCYDVGVTLEGTSGRIDFKFTQPKCSRYATLNVAEHHLEGEYHNLDSLSVDMSDWLDIHMTTENNTFSLQLGNTNVFTRTYQQPLGGLRGMVIYFYGSGKIDHVRLQNTRGAIHYEENFSKRDE